MMLEKLMNTHRREFLKKIGIGAAVLSFPGCTSMLTKPKTTTEKSMSSDERAEAIIHRIRAGHYGNLTFIDRQVEQILDALEGKGQLDDTIIVYSADHGSHLGDHNNIHKGTHYERSARVPCVVRCPQRFTPGRVSGFSGHVDLPVTFLSLAGVPVPAAMEGRDLTKLWTGETDAVQDHVIIEIRGTTSIVTDRWKMGVNPRDRSGDLYDLNADQAELENLYYDPAYSAVRKELTAKLIGFNPELEAQLDAPRSRPTSQTEYILKQGQKIPARKGPEPCGKTITITAEIDNDASDTAQGPVVICHLGAVHGCALYLENGRPAFGLRRWHTDTIISGAEKLLPGTSIVEARVDTKGGMAIAVNGGAVVSGQAEGGIPVQPGHPDYFRAELIAGGAHERIKPIGTYKKGSTFDGTIKAVKITVEDTA